MDKFAPPAGYTATRTTMTLWGDSILDRVFWEEEAAAHGEVISQASLPV